MIYFDDPDGNNLELIIRLPKEIVHPKNVFESMGKAKLLNYPKWNLSLEGFSEH